MVFSLNHSRHINCCDGKAAKLQSVSAKIAVLKRVIQFAFIPNKDSKKF